jgi:hypothetical protein
MFLELLEEWEVLFLVTKKGKPRFSFRTFPDYKM